jgi:hypothetical protein
MEEEFDSVELILPGNLAILRGTEANRLSDATGGEPHTIRQRAFFRPQARRVRRLALLAWQTNLSQRDGEIGEP